MAVEEIRTQYAEEVIFVSDYELGSDRNNKSSTMLIDHDDLDLSLGSDRTLLRFEKTMHNESSHGHIWGSTAGGVDSLKKMEQIYAKLALERIGVVGGVDEASKDAILRNKQDGHGDGLRDYSGSSSDEFMALPMQMAAWAEVGVPRFLTTTFHLVDSPETDRFIRWSETQNSFIVKDHIEFSSIILPRYFKHRNFSSFIRQLNTYGFRKTGYDRWEFAHVHFRKGRKDMLKNIKRKGQVMEEKEAKSAEIERSALEIELHLLSKQKEMLEMEVEELRLQQESSNLLITDVQNKFQLAESKYESFTLLLAKAIPDPNFILQLIQSKKMQTQEAGAEISQEEL